MGMTGCGCSGPLAYPGEPGHVWPGSAGHELAVAGFDCQAARNYRGAGYHREVGPQSY